MVIYSIVIIKRLPFRFPIPGDSYWRFFLDKGEQYNYTVIHEQKTPAVTVVHHNVHHLFLYVNARHRVFRGLREVPVFKQGAGSNAHPGLSDVFPYKPHIPLDSDRHHCYED